MDVHLCTKLYYIHLLYIRDKVVVQEVNVKYIKKNSSIYEEFISGKQQNSLYSSKKNLKMQKTYKVFLKIFQYQNRRV